MRIVRWGRVGQGRLECRRGAYLVVVEGLVCLVPREWTMSSGWSALNEHAQAPRLSGFLDILFITEHATCICSST